MDKPIFTPILIILMQKKYKFIKKYDILFNLNIYDMQ